MDTSTWQHLTVLSNLFHIGKTPTMCMSARGGALQCIPHLSLGALVLRVRLPAARTLS